jgi:hypothetical protein
LERAVVRFELILENKADFIAAPKILNAFQAEAGAVSLPALQLEKSLSVIRVRRVAGRPGNGKPHINEAIKRDTRRGKRRGGHESGRSGGSERRGERSAVHKILSLFLGS